MSVRTAHCSAILHNHILNNMLHKVAQWQFDGYFIWYLERGRNDRHSLHFVSERIIATFNAKVHIETVVANGHISTIACCRHKWECRHTDERIGIIIGAKDGSWKIWVEAIDYLSWYAVLRDDAPIEVIAIGNKPTLHINSSKAILHVATYRLHIHQSYVTAVCSNFITYHTYCYRKYHLSLLMTKIRFLKRTVRYITLKNS